MGSQTPGQAGQTGRRLAAGECRDGGARRKTPSGDQKSGGGAWRDAGPRPHPTEPSARAGEDQIDGGEGSAVAGVRACSGTAMGCTVGQAGGGFRLVGGCGARCRARFQAPVAAASAVTSPAAWGSRAWWLTWLGVEIDGEERGDRRRGSEGVGRRSQ